MTPLQIKMVLHYYAIAEPYGIREPQHAESPAVYQQRGALVALGLIEEDGDWPAGYRTTGRGNAYVEALCAMDLPIQKWVMPDRAA